MEEYITTEMPLAVFLNISGHTHQRLERKGRRCHWVFARVGNLMELVDSYFTESSCVDVQDALDTGKQLREEMYDFMKAVRA